MTENVDPAVVIQSLVKRHAQLYADLSQECAMLEAGLVAKRAECERLYADNSRLRSLIQDDDLSTSTSVEFANPPAGD